MTNFPKPVILCSACLGFRACRYNGVTILDPLVEKLKAHVEFRPVCPEAEIGLGIPRDPIRVVLAEGRRTLYQPATGRDVGEAMREFARRHLDAAGAVDGFLFKGRSPSCGTRDVKIYASSKPEAGSTRGAGLFGEEVLARFPAHPTEEEGRLKSFVIREHFLIGLFLLAELRGLQAKPSIQGLIDFHTRHKLLLMAYSQSRMRDMGRALAAYDKSNLAEVSRLYEEGLRQALAKPLSYTAMINALQHAFGGLTGDLTADEKRFFLNALEEYRDERVPLTVPLRLLEAWSLRQGNRYLLSQSLLNPFPRELTEITDSGKGRDL